MSNWRSERGYALRYLGSGAVNTIVGFAVIFLLTGFGVQPIWANVAGYAVGFVLGFVVSRRLVFRSQGGIGGEALRYLVAFIIAFALNLCALHLALQSGRVGVLAAQLIAAATYTAFMYLQSRLFVFGSPRGGG